MVIKNAEIIDGSFERRKADLRIEDGKIAQIAPSIDAPEVMDFSGCTVVPGFVDIHIHGCDGADTSDASEVSLEKMSAYLVKKGVTSFCPTTMTLPYDDLAQQMGAVSRYMGKESGAYIHGVNMEGPYISLEKKGAQCAQYVREADFEEFSRLSEICKICLVDVAPETRGACEFACKASKLCTVSAAHTAATYEQAVRGFASGFTHATHLFNAMTPIANRKPGVVTAALVRDSVTAELICDGFHNHPAILSMAFKLLGEDRAVVVSDSMKAAGCADGEYELGGQRVYVKQGRALLADGTIAASTSNIYEEFLNLLRFGIPFKTALRACTINPSRVIGVSGETGSIDQCKAADLVVLDGDMKIKAVFVKGKLLVDNTAKE